jgi:hypothetical protein
MFLFCFVLFCDNTHRIKTKSRFSTERKQSNCITSADSSEHPEAGNRVEAASKHLRRISRMWMHVSMVWGLFVREKEFEALKQQSRGQQQRNVSVIARIFKHTHKQKFKIRRQKCHSSLKITPAYNAAPTEQLAPQLPLHVTCKCARAKYFAHHKTSPHLPKSHRPQPAPHCKCILPTLHCPQPI